MSPIVSEQYQFVIGVDTHAATHTFAVLAVATGGPAQGQLPDRDPRPWPHRGLDRSPGRRRQRADRSRGHRLLCAILTERLELAG